jgi:DNA polymerase-1
MRVALCDGDLICYRQIAANTKSFSFGSSVDVDKAISDATTMVEEWTEMAGCTESRVLFTGEHNFRKFISPTYKMGRKEKPEGYWEVVRAVRERFPCDCVDGLEADDLMGILGTSPRWFDRSVVVSLDKDMATLPCHIFNPNKDPAPRLIHPTQADYFWWTQTLTGDITDGYPGVPGVGPKKAKHWLTLNVPRGTEDPMWHRVRAAYLDAGLTEEDALLNARMARILRHDDYDKPNKAVKLWHPKQPRSLPLATVCVFAGIAMTSSSEIPGERGQPEP